MTDKSDMMKSATHTLRNLELKDMEARALTDGVAILAYRVDEESTVDSKPVMIEAAHSSTWIKRNGRWSCALVPVQLEMEKAFPH